MDKPKITPEQIRNSVRHGLGLRDETLLWLADELEKRGAVGVSEERKLLLELKELTDNHAADAKVYGNDSEYDYFTSLSGRITALLSAPAPEPVDTRRLALEEAAKVCDAASGRNFLLIANEITEEAKHKRGAKAAALMEAAAAIRALAAQHPEPASQMGQCCYGGTNLKSACGSCAAWKPLPKEDKQ